jgi:D-beta-D-heptose 7-phosphate kinase/D-beta-D-heptose 1-phosphate adenosyltransferase
LCKKVIKIANTNKIKVLVDPKSKIECFMGAYLFKPNLKELSHFLDRELNDRKDIEDGIISIFNMYNFKNIMVTLGSDGILHYDGKKFIHSRSNSKEVYDVSGAGDTVISAYAHSLIENKKIIDNLDFCNQAASIVISKFGTAVATKKELYEEN